MGKGLVYKELEDFLVKKNIRFFALALVARAFF